MNIYVETNFVLELAFLQEQYESCNAILTLCESGNSQMVLPSFCVAEAYEVLIRQTKKREQLASSLAGELRQLTRFKPAQDLEKVEAFQNTIKNLGQASRDEEQRLVSVLNRILRIAIVIPLEAEIILASVRYRTNNGFDPQDAIVLSSVLHHLSTGVGVERCFVNKNKHDFDDSDIAKVLMAMQCQILFNFDTALHYIQK